IAAHLGRQINSIPCFSKEILGKKMVRSENTLNFGYYGRFIPEKGIDILCKLSDDSDLKDIQIHLWGEGQDYPTTFFTKYPKIKYHGTFSGQEELSKVINSLDALLLISTNPEGLPIMLLEAM